MSEDAERNELAERVAAELRRPVALRPDFERRVMEAVRAAAGPRRMPGPIRWLLRPRTVEVTPLGGLALAATLAALVLGASLLVRPPRPAPAATPIEAAAGLEVVRFVLAAPGASRVVVVGDFNDWDQHATPLQRAGRGSLWSVDVPLRPGRHEYAFIVDGREWRLDPTAPRAVANDFGPPNSVILVGAYRL
jgi:hypothetical protein